MKDADPSELEFALHAVARGENYLTPAVSKTVIENYVVRATTRADPIERLTTRQREVLQLVAEGKTTREIAAVLNVSVKTVELDRSQVMEQLGLADLTALVRFAVRHGLVLPD
jgi:DNA-binding NarL/FixJ family response regulator